jgi:hypothetical protein
LTDEELIESMAVFAASLRRRVWIPAFAGTTAECFCASQKFPDSHFKQPSAFVLAPPRELGF